MRVVMKVLEGLDKGKAFVFETQERFADIRVGRDEPDSPAELH